MENETCSTPSASGATKHALFRFRGLHQAWVMAMGMLLMAGCAHVAPGGQTNGKPETPQEPVKKEAKGTAEMGAGLSEWIGHYPSDALGKPPRALLDTSQVKHTLKHILPAAHYQLIRKTLTLETPIECIEGYLFVVLCEPHNAPGRNAALLFGLKGQAVLVVVYEASGDRDDKGCTTCYSTGRLIQDLPESLKEAILQVHIPRMHKEDKLLSGNQWLNDVLTHVVPPESVR